ncbi:MAG: hypothetical protein FWD23_11645, partial [Oscillospiraceae bacterium]|nr:hypothetical protein [Oscillospiraceae bacterium]
MGEREYRDANEGALTYMEEKYGEKFEYIKSHGWLMSTKSRGILVSCETYPGKEIYISIVKEGK